MLLEDIGINPERVALEWVSGAEAPQFAEKVNQFTEKIIELGPNRFRKKEIAACQ
jgi:F420-non-reducing hydrogenase iron-sulfur subunit